MSQCIGYYTCLALRNDLDKAPCGKDCIYLKEDNKKMEKILAAKV